MTPPQSATAAAPAPAPVAAEPALPEPKPEDMQMLTEMGFPAERAKKALWLNRYVLLKGAWLVMCPDATTLTVRARSLSLF
jgi:hypothetical protein